MIPAVTVFWIAVFIVVALFDWKKHRIPNAIVYPCLAVAVVLAYLDSYTGIDIYSRPFLPVNALISGVICWVGLSVIFILFAFGYKIGEGDVKYVALIGLVLGYPASLFIVLITAVTSIATAWILIKRGYKANFHVPYGVFLSLGAIIAILLPDFLLRMVS